MTTVDECIHLLPPAQCTICNGRDASYRRPLRGGHRIITARFTGPCADCGHLVHEGDEARWYADTREVVHHQPGCDR